MRRTSPKSKKNIDTAKVVLHGLERQIDSLSDETGTSGAITDGIKALVTQIQALIGSAGH